jgi:cysteine desulfurase/selenocysteine lyase
METVKVAPSQVSQWRKDFPILQEKIRGKPLVYLDNAASSQKPRVVIDTISHYYLHEHANVHRGVHTLSQKATDKYEQARERVQHFLHAAHSKEIIFTRGTTESINLVAQSFVRPRLKPGDEVLISALEHHSNIVPWQMICEKTQAQLKVIPMNKAGELVLDTLDTLLSPRTRFLALSHVSNALGTINPVALLIKKAHERGIPVLLDGAQAVPHLPVDVQKLDCDFYAFSSHKVFGPTGVGVLFGKSALLEEMEPYQGGGEMILSVTFEKTKYNVIPHKFEAGTPSIAGVLGLGAALEYLQSFGIETLGAYEEELLSYATEQVSRIPDVRIIGTAKEKAAVLSFELGSIHPHDIGTILDQEGIAIRTGHHCAQPVMHFLGIPATARASFAFYNTKEEVDALVRGIHKVIEVFA